MITLGQNAESHISTYWNRPGLGLDFVKQSSFMFGKYEGEEYTTFRNRMHLVEAGMKLLCLGLRLAEEMQGSVNIIPEALL